MRRLLFVPADLPKIEFKERTLAAFEARHEAHNFSYQKLTEKSASPYDCCVWSSEAKERFPHLIDWIDANIPYRQLANVKIVSPSKHIAPHIDFTDPTMAPDLYRHNRTYEPCGFRLVLRDPGVKSLYVLLRNGRRVYVDLPGDTDAYLISHTATLHGLDPLPLGRVTVFIHAWVDPEAHRRVLERSRRRYSEFAVYEETDLEL